jgi:hypothetical protein
MTHIISAVPAATVSERERYFLQMPSIRKYVSSLTKRVPVTTSPGVFFACSGVFRSNRAPGFRTRLTFLG